MHTIKRIGQLVGMTSAMLILVLGICGTLALSLPYLVDPAAYASFFGARDPAALRRPQLLLHIVGGMMALLLGLLQLSVRLRHRRKLHVLIGVVYASSVTLSAIAAIAIAPFSYGGLFNGVGFALLGVIWIGATATGIALRWAGRPDLHRPWMILSYALTLAAVSLRLQLPLLEALPGVGYDRAYSIVVWSCWVPNLIIIGLWQWRKSRLA